MTSPGALMELATVFGRLGMTCFGGPVAHIGYFHADLVRKRGWLDERHFADLVALCNFLPGPASSQFVFAVGMQRAGLAGALVASLCFLAPSLAMMILLGYGIASIPDLARAGWVLGLKVAAVAVVAHAVLGMARRFCTSVPTVLLAIASGLVVLAFQNRPGGTFLQAGVIMLSGMLGFLTLPFHLRLSASVPRDEQAKPSGNSLPPAVPPVQECTREAAASQLSRRLGFLCLLVFMLLLFLSPPLASPRAPKLVQLADKCYRSGALVFGGGHVVLPLLRAEFLPTADPRVPSIATDEFLAGYGGAQAVPGPMFSFAGYLGTVMSPFSPRWVSGVVCAGAIFLPAYLLIAGALPFWQYLRQNRRARAGMDAAGAAVVGVLGAALYSPVGTEGIRHWSDAVAAVIGLVLLLWAKAPPLLVVVLCALFGLVAHAW